MPSIECSVWVVSPITGREKDDAISVPRQEMWERSSHRQR
jgi:hypothetical protein